MKWLFEFLFAIPWIPAFGGFFTNRVNAHWWFCSISDVKYNCSDWYYRFTKRLPGNQQSEIVRDKDGKITGSINRQDK